MKHCKRHWAPEKTIMPMVDLERATQHSHNLSIRMVSGSIQPICRLILGLPSKQRCLHNQWTLVAWELVDSKQAVHLGIHEAGFERNNWTCQLRCQKASRNKLNSKTQCRCLFAFVAFLLLHFHFVLHVLFNGLCFDVCSLFLFCDIG